MNSYPSEFLNVVSKYTTDVETQKLLWNEIVEAYSYKTRFYHTLSHLEDLFSKLFPLKNQFSNWDVIVFAIAYHDFIYNALKPDNEERSALYAEKKLWEIEVDKGSIDNCKEIILATKKHLPSSHEINLFTDADLSILGSSEDDYQVYTENVRQEYAIFPSLIYNHGRKKVLMHFLSMARIFKTDEFYERFEEQARANLETELVNL